MWTPHGKAFDVSHGNDFGGTYSITTFNGLFNNVEHISFMFNSQDILRSILINIIPEQCDIMSMKDILELNKDRLIGKPLYITTENSIWKRGNSIVHLETNPSMYISINNQIL